MEHRDQRQESHGVHVCNKCGWPFSSSHPSAKRRRAHKRVCGTIEGFKLVESEANTLLTVSDNDGYHNSSSLEVLGGSCSDNGVDGTKTKSKESGDEVFSDAVAEFSEGIGPNKSMGDALNSESMSKMVAEDEMNSSRATNDTEVFETTIHQSGSEQEHEINQELLNIETDSRIPLSCSSTENQKVEDSIVAETAIDRSGNVQETKVDQELMNLVTDLGTPLFISSTEQETKFNQELVVLHDDHMNTTTASDLNPIEPETIVPLQQEKNIHRAENVPRCSLPSPDTRYDEKKNEGFGSFKNSAEIAAPPGRMDNDKSEPVSKMEETIEIPKEPTAHNGNDLESCSCHILLETDEIKERNDNVPPPSVSSDLNVVERREALVDDSKDHKDLKLTDYVVQDRHEGVGGSGDNFKDPVRETSQAEPFDPASEVASFDTGVKNVSVDVRADCSRNSNEEVEEIPVKEVNATEIKSELDENEKHDKSRNLSDAANFGIDSVPSASFSPEVEPVASSMHSLDNLSENVTDVVFDENSAAPTGNLKKLDDNEVGNGGVLRADDENKAGACGTHSEDMAQIYIPEETVSTGIDSTMLESNTNSRENRCRAVAEEIANESPRKFSGTENADTKSFGINLVSDAQQSVKDDDHGDDQSCHVAGFSAVQNSSDVDSNKEANLVSVSNESVTGRSDAPRDGSVSQLVGGVRITSETWQDDTVKTDVRPQLTSSLLDASVDASSQTDSLEGNWGSVSVLSTQSDLPAVVDGEATLQARAEAAGNNSERMEAATKRQHSDRCDLFEPPSFMTLVEPEGGGIQSTGASEIQTDENQQQRNPASLQAGWFPSYTHVAKDSPGRKKNEAVIAKVTNWSTGKPHTALKNLLDDAALENKQKSSPTRKENLASMIQKDENSTENSVVNATVGSVTRPRSPASQLGNREIPNEWNSPARYPSDIRRERRKGKPYWAQFVCCSSVH
ncbi:uncharacterized protein LOC111448858 isoform X1 [Cucurbita moschata]|uniref:Uncharacterized protein LOC111448858 isoform X1 n=1 Tax=Cucurbita moschata TaxID=3662 RepID=A0A6J1FYM9_CUCMO|nr:uncharacterized protein LOC111448858 isoform X1 [Cucurbita moschata]